MNKTKYIILILALSFFLVFAVYSLKTFAETKYSCNTSTWQCEEDPNGYPYISKQWCQNNCYPSAEWSCSTITEKCFANGVNGQYASLGACQDNCPAGSTSGATSSDDIDDDITDDEPEQATTTRYHCDSQNRKCIEDPQGIYPSLSACTDICYQTPAMEGRYYCDTLSQTCFERSDGLYQGLARCLEICVKPFGEVIPRYSCNSNTKTCYEDVQGPYSPLSNCEIFCTEGTIKCPGNDYCYKCDRATLQCYQTKEGTYTSLQRCQDVGCTDSCTGRYSCNRPTNKCYQVDMGTYSSLSACEAECAKKPEWQCHISGSCFVQYIDPDQPFRYFSSQEECKYECPEMERTQDGRWIKYKCSTSTGKCYQNLLTGAGYWTRRTCEANCPPKYSCDPSTLKCIEDPNGKYSNLTECEKDCKPRYSCDTSTWTCYLDPNGYFTRKNDCEFRCAEPLTLPNVPRYSCDKSTWTCFVDTPHGAFSPLSTCEYLCQPGGVTIQCVRLPNQSGLSNPRCWSCNLTTCQCYQNTDGVFGQLHKCLEHCTPERCAAGTTPGVSTPCRSCSGGVAACTGTPSSQVAPSEDTTPPVPSSQVAPSEDTTPPVNGFMVPPSTQPSVTTGGCGASPSTEAPPAGDPWNLEYWIKFWTK